MKIASQLLLVFFLYGFSGYTQIQNNGNLRIHTETTVGFFGNFTNNGTFTNNLGTLQAVGTNAQIFNGTNVIHTNNFTINKASNSVQLDNELQVAGVLTFTSGKILSDYTDMATEFVHFLAGASYAGASNTSHIDGVVRKTGNSAFAFPIGDNNLLRKNSISAPINVTDHFTGYYTNTNPDGTYSRSLLGVGLEHVSSCEYWILNRTGGSSNVEVTLSWASNSCGVDNLCEMMVARWDGTRWTSEGNGGTTGTIVGTVVSGNNCTTPDSVANFSPFTLGSSSNNNPLPIELLFFQAERCSGGVKLLWQTASEINNDYFTIEKSKDSYNWEEVIEISGAGHSSNTTDYCTIDENPYLGVSYYRLKQTDFDGHYSYSQIRSVNINESENLQISVYPNPATNQITVKGISPVTKDVEFYNSTAQNITSLIRIIECGEFKLQFDITMLPSGIYTLNTKSGSSSMFVKN
tara:strand:- start:1661 stop:3052 length:1392 start_codon:yes stop_codon:yes gene_type:complete